MCVSVCECVCFSHVPYTVCCVALPCCLFDLACFFLPSFSSLIKNMYYKCLMRDERRKEERSKQGQTNKAKQHSTPKAVTFPKKNELPRVGLEPTTLYTLDRVLYH